MNLTKFAREEKPPRLPILTAFLHRFLFFRPESGVDAKKAGLHACKISLKSRWNFVLRAKIGGL
jgi:hypothetical protein